MKKLLALASLALAVVPWLNAQSLTAEELQRAADHLEKTRAAFLAATDGLSAAQADFKPGPTRWSVAEVSEHIAATEDFLRELIVNQVLKAPARAEAVDVKEIDEFILTAVPDRTRKATAPEPLVPTVRFGGLDGSRRHFGESRARTLALLRETPDLRDHAIDSPFGRKLDGYQWLLFISAHCERHTKQIDEVKADPNFPAS